VLSFPPLRGSKALDGFDQAEVAFADQIEEREAKVLVVVCDFDDEAQVGLDHVDRGQPCRRGGSGAPVAPPRRSSEEGVLAISCR